MTQDLSLRLVEFAHEVAIAVTENGLDSAVLARLAAKRASELSPMGWATRQQVADYFGISKWSVKSLDIPGKRTRFGWRYRWADVVAFELPTVPASMEAV